MVCDILPLDYFRNKRKATMGELRKRSQWDDDLCNWAPLR